MPAQIVAGGIHLVNSNGAPTAGGTATAASTTPFSIRNRWPLGVADPMPIMSGGPPFTLGSRPLMLGYDNVTETIPINVQGSSHENAVARLQELKRALNTALFSTPALLSVLPTASSTIMYAEIYYAVVRELTDDSGNFDAWEGTTEIDAEITWVRALFFNPAGLTTLQNGLTFTNSGTGANNNTQSLGSPAGDLIYEGSPLNIKIAPTLNSGARYYYLATVYQRLYVTAISGSDTTSSTTGAAAWEDSTATISDPARTRNGLRLRVMLRCTTISAKAQVQVFLVSRGSGRTLWRGPWVSAGSTGATQLDATPSGVPLDLIRRATLENGDVNVGLLIRSTDGTSVTVNTHSVEYLLYYTFCRVDATSNITGATGSGFDFVQIESAQNLNGTAYAPLQQPAAYIGGDVSGTDMLNDIADIRGTVPRAISGASLYLSWLSSTFGFDATDTAIVTTTHLPLYRSLRGSG